MLKRFDDVLLGDLVVLKGGRLEDFGHDGLMKLIRISDGHRRGDGEGEDALIAVDED